MRSRTRSRSLPREVTRPTTGGTVSEPRDDAAVAFAPAPAIVFSMFFVAIETSGLRGSLALFSDGVCLSESVFEEGLVHGEVEELLPVRTPARR